MSLLPSVRLGFASLRAARLSSCGGANLVVNKSKHGCLTTSPSLLVQSTAGISGKAKYEEWPKPPPWDYKNRLYRSWHSYIDGTLKRFDENSKFIIIDGLPGIGKDELAKQLAEEFDMKYFPGVTMDYKYITGYGFDLRTLDPKIPPVLRSYDENTFLKSPKDKRLVLMQTDMFYLAYSQYIDALVHLFNTGQGVIITRNPFTHLAFMEGCFKAGYINSDDLRKAYGRIREKAIPDLLKPHLILYLDTPVSVVQDKMRQRGKGEEKVITKEFLETMEAWYKTKFLKDIEVNSEVMVYDWAEPGDFEVVVEDIERINFDRYEDTPRHPKFKDWRYEEDIVASEIRFRYTTQKMILMQNTRYETNDVESMIYQQDDLKVLHHVYYNAPGFKYIHGFNPDQGDNVWFKMSPGYPSVERNTMIATYVP